MRRATHWVLAALSLILLTTACAAGDDERADNSREGTTMTDRPTDLWQLISAVAAQAPLTNDKLNTLLGTRFEGTGRHDSGPTTVTDGLELPNVTNFSRDNGDWVFSSLDIGAEPCVGLDEVKAHYGDVEMTAAPSGHSLEERYLWTSQQPWGALNFAIRERDRCLVGVSLYTAGEYKNKPFPKG
ncbi:hypothetical protein ACFXK0_21110 [Nocardia sp. NPDC059177]|uniref:hypothetical protein n=1 Tax=Nocardia sp. NPDC059177 TaxID=3346759 RepID=UPI0036B171C5